MMTETRKYINSDRVNVQVSFEISERDWEFVKKKKSWKRFRKIVERMEEVRTN